MNKSLSQDPSRAPARAMLKAAGFTDSDLSKPLVGVVNSWAEVTLATCIFVSRQVSQRRNPSCWWHPHRVQHHRGVR